MLDRPGVRVVERFVQRVHPIDVSRVGSRVIVEQHLPGLADAARGGLEDGLVAIERGLLLDARNLDPGCEPRFPVIRMRAAVDDPEEARLAGAVTPDEADVLSRLHDEVGVVEERHVAVGEGNFRELKQRHGPRISSDPISPRSNQRASGTPSEDSARRWWSSACNPTG
jgi:hypothetical protein